MIDVRRCAYFPFGTYSYITFGDKVRVLVERELRSGHNAYATPPVYSCVPEAEYVLEPHNTPHHPDTWALVNHAANVFHEPGPGVPSTAWFAVLLHPGNTPKDVLACLAPGAHFAMFGDVLGVADSRVTYDELHSYIKQTGDLKLRIWSDVRTPWPST